MSATTVAQPLYIERGISGAGHLAHVRIETRSIRPVGVVTVVGRAVHQQLHGRRCPVRPDAELTVKRGAGDLRQRYGHLQCFALRPYVIGSLRLARWPEARWSDRP